MYYKNLGYSKKKMGLYMDQISLRWRNWGNKFKRNIYSKGGDFLVQQGLRIWVWSWLELSIVKSQTQPNFPTHTKTGCFKSALQRLQRINCSTFQLILAIDLWNKAKSELETQGPHIWFLYFLSAWATFREYSNAVLNINIVNRPHGY